MAPPRIQIVVRQAPPPLELRPRWPGSRDHFAATFRGREIGRIYQAQDASPPRWHWYVLVPMVVPDWTQGVSEDAATAKTDLETAWGRLLRTITPDRLQRAWEFEDAAMKRAGATADAAPDAAAPEETPSLQALLAQAGSAPPNFP